MRHVACAFGLASTHVGLNRPVFGRSRNVNGWETQHWRIVILYLWVPFVWLKKEEAYSSVLSANVWADLSEIWVIQTKNNLILELNCLVFHILSLKKNLHCSARPHLCQPCCWASFQTAAGESVWEKHWQRIASSLTELVFSHLHQRSNTSKV